jgi:multiple sugar transport system permease protein
MWYGPILYTFFLSLTKYKLVGTATFTGLKNYLDIFQDRFFWHGLQVTFVFTVAYVPVISVFGLLTAYLLNIHAPGKNVWRAIIYLPAVLPAIAVFVLGKFVFYPSGLVNTVLSWLGMQGPLWLSNPNLILIPAVLLMAWKCGAAMIVYLGAMQGVPEQYYQAAEIDGLGKLGQFFRITLPMISHAIYFRLIVDIKLGLMIFIPALVLPKGNVPGGPSHASRFYALHVYEKAFQRFNIGEACALAMVLIVISVIITRVIMRLGERYVYYEV